MPMSDVVGKTITATDVENGITRGQFDFSVSATTSSSSIINYEIYATDETVTNGLDAQYVKVYLTDGTTDEAIAGYENTVPTYDTLSDATMDTGKLLYSGNFTSSGTKNFKLRMRVKDTYPITEESKTFTMKVNVKAITA